VFVSASPPDVQDSETLPLWVDLSENPGDTIEIPASGVSTAYLLDAAVTSAKIANGAVTPAKLSQQPVQVTHPNTDDVLVQVWDSTLGRWQTTWYDSGWRNLSASLLNGYTGTAHLRRTSGMCVLAFENLPTSASVTAFTALSLPAGFRPSYLAQRGLIQTSAAAIARKIVVAGDGSVDITGWSNGETLNGTFAFPVDSAIPTSLPGTLVTAAPA